MKCFKLIGLLLTLSAVARCAAGTRPNNPVPPVCETPVHPGGPEAALKRLSAGSARTPTVKSFTLKWVRSLAERGHPKVYTRENSSNFDYIGMPIGGIGSGQLYLGGDGKLWWWDIFNTRPNVPGPPAYAHPPRRGESKPQLHVKQGFALRLEEGGKTLRLDRQGPWDIEFRGQYPIGYVKYTRHAQALEVKLEAFSPFIPLELEDSSYPATVLNFTVTNTGDKPLRGELAGWLENAVCIESRHRISGILTNRIVKRPGLTFLDCRAGRPEKETEDEKRPHVLFEDFENGYGRWKVEGEAFGKAPGPNYHHQTLKGYRGEGLADSFHNRGQKATARASDAPTGTLISEPFEITRRRIAFLIGGGAHKGKTCLNLLVDGKCVRTATGDNTEVLKKRAFDVSGLQGKTARLQVVDQASGGWGHMMVDHIVFTDEAVTSIHGRPLEEHSDYGSMGLALLEGEAAGRACIESDRVIDALFSAETSSQAKKDFAEGALVGGLGRTFSLAGGEKATIKFLVAWYFPHLRLPEFGREVGRRYGARFDDALQVALHVAENLERLAGGTSLWHDTWYDSTLPWWFLDRTFLNTSILATSTCYLFRSRRFYSYEGVYHSVGTCTHVWGYVQATGRLFPAIERRLRERVDYNPEIAFHPETGMINYRGQHNNADAVDGQSGVILRTLRQHQVSEGDAFLRRVYAPMKKAMNYLIHTYDKDGDGILTGGQHNTLDAKWYGKITWLSLYYQAALRAAAEMAGDMENKQYARRLRRLADRGREYVEEELLYKGEYFIQKPDPDHPKSPGSFRGCEYSQLMGQSWAYQVGLGLILDRDKVTAALNSLWKYNFTTDVGPYRETALHRNGRWFAMPGEGGLVACTFPYGGGEVLKHGRTHFAGYLNECQAGYEYAATSLMMWHGLVDKALAHVKAVHERYHGSKRNPWNEVEWGTHYSRSMAGYGEFTAICGYEYDGPEGYIAFSPRLTSGDFRAAFTAASGWGTFRQRRSRGKQVERLELKWGRLKLKKLAFDLPEDSAVTKVTSRKDSRQLPCDFYKERRRVFVVLNLPLKIEAGQNMTVTLGYNKRD